MSVKPWENYITTETLSQEKLAQLNSEYFPKLIMSAPKGEFIQTIATQNCESQLVTTTGTSLSKDEISDFSDFTINTFYKVHIKYYPDKEIEVFKKHQKIFFSLPFHFIRHELDNKIIAYLTVAMLEQHSFFKEPVWHIGYWGIDSSLKNKGLRAIIKSDWGNVLFHLNKVARIAGNIDYFNNPAISMASLYGMKINGYRMDPR